MFKNIIIFKVFIYKMDTIILGLIVILLAILVFMIICFKKINDSISVINDYNSKFDELTSRIDKLTSMFEIMNIENEPFTDKLHDTMSNNSQIVIHPSVDHQEVINHIDDEKSINISKEDHILEDNNTYIMKNIQDTTDEENNESQILTSNIQEKEDNNEELPTETTQITEENPTIIINQATIDCSKQSNEVMEQHIINDPVNQNEIVVNLDYSGLIDYLNTHTVKQAKMNELKFLIVQEHIDKIYKDVYFMNKKDMYNKLKEITKDKINN